LKSYLKLIFFYILQFAINSQGLAAIYDYQYTPPASVDSSVFAYYRIYIPDSVDTIKGVYCYVSSGMGSSLYITNHPYYQTYVENKDFALMGFMMSSIYTGTFWPGEGLITALKELSILSGHSEIEYSALLFDGISSGGQFSYHFTQWKPERVIAFITIKGGYHSLSPAGDAIKVPGYMFIGEYDLDYRITNLTTIFEKHRPLGALWALAMEPNAGHGRVSYEIIHSFFDQIIPMRIPKIIPDDTIPQLIEIAEEKGWLGNRETYIIKYYSDYTGDKTKACWFPNVKIAQEWQNFVQGKPLTNIYLMNHTLPEHIILYQNYPNPFNPSTIINYSLPIESVVTVTVYDMLGKEINRLISQKKLSGKHTIQWNGHDNDGITVSAGIYFYQLQTGEFVQTKKMLLMK
jgi:hypothetical protein